MRWVGKVNRRMFDSIRWSKRNIGVRRVQVDLQIGAEEIRLSLYLFFNDFSQLVANPTTSYASSHACRRVIGLPSRTDLFISHDRGKEVVQVIHDGVKDARSMNGGQTEFRVVMSQRILHDVGETNTVSLRGSGALKNAALNSRAARWG